MKAAQIDLDFEGSDPEIQLRLKWAANAARERAFWTPERRCLAWMQSTTPDDSDMEWWNSQPKYKRQEWLNLHEREQKRMLRLKTPRRSFQKAWEEWDALIQEGVAQDEAKIRRYMEILREDFLHGRPCSISFEGGEKSFYRDHCEHLLRVALDRLAVPSECLAAEGKEVAA